MPEPQARSGRARLALTLTREVLRFGLIAAAGLWIVAVGLPDSAVAPGLAMGRRVLQDATFDQGEVRAAIASLPARATSDAAWARAILSLRLFEIVRSTPDIRAEDVAQARNAADQAVRDALVLTPYNGFLWYALFALRLPEEGQASTAPEAFLAKSYQLAPWEGWVAIRRSPTLMPIREALPASVRPMIEGEFRNLLQQNILPPIQRIFVYSGPDVRMEILRHLETLPLLERNRILRGLARELEATSKG